MAEMYDKILGWENLRLAHQKAAKGKRGKQAAANFEWWPQNPYTGSTHRGVEHP
jgi:hypothetical protein